ncbi:MAG: hypothetical protein GX386_09985 [Clostridiaceae bacterium]|jgi:hypothetical protein|nr:hypothetical protein [Clostridiaceae bacterium]
MAEGSKDKNAGAKQHEWYRLDNAALIYPSIQSDRITTMFRLSMTLKETVDPKILQISLEEVIKKFPFYRVRLKKGFFWYYLEHNPKLPRVERDVRYPLGRLHPNLGRRFLFRVRYWQSRIAVEFCHVLTDGTGGMTFLKALVYDYLKRKGKDPGEPGDIPVDVLSGEAAEDAYNRFYKSPLPLPDKGRKAFHQKGKMLYPGAIMITSGIIPLETIIKEAKKYKVSLTAFLVAVYIDALQELQDILVAQNPKKRPIALQVPVNMRGIYPSKTLRNFSLFVMPEIDPRLGKYDFEEILQIVRETLITQTNEKAISKSLSRNVGGQRNWIIRVIPLIFKKLLMPFLYTRMGENLCSGTLSNLGLIRLPDKMANEVERVDFILGTNPINKTGCAVCGFNDKLVINFGSNTRDKSVERLFFTRLIRMGIPVKIEVNEDIKKDNSEFRRD